MKLLLAVVAILVALAVPSSRAQDTETAPKGYSLSAEAVAALAAIDQGEPCNPDRLAEVLEYEYGVCLWADTRMRTRILLAIHRQEFSEDLYDESIIGNMAAYRVAHEAGRGSTAYDSLQTLTAALARSLAERTDSTSLEHLWAAFLAGEFDYFDKRIGEPGFIRAKLKKYTDRAAHPRTGWPHMSAEIGVWTPLGLGDTLDLGSLPEFGAAFRWTGKKVSFGGCYRFRFGKTTGRYYVNRGGPYTSYYETFTDNIYSYYLGVEVGNMLTDEGPVHFEALAGAGFSGIRGMLKTAGERTTATGSEMNVGLRARIFPNGRNEWFMLIGLRFGFVSYSGAEMRDSSGNTVSLSVGIGGILPPY